MDDRVRVFGEVISDKTRLSILELLHKAGPLRWSEVMNHIESIYGRINPNRLRFHLNFMLEREAISRDMELEGSRNVKRLRISDWAMEFLNKLEESSPISPINHQERRAVLEERFSKRMPMDGVKPEKKLEIDPPGEEGLWDLKIDPEFSSLLDPVEPEADKALGEAIRISKYVEPILIWNGTIIDGHRRYKICKNKNIPFRTREIHFEDRSEAKIFMLTFQVAERNLPYYESAELEKKIEGIKSHKNPPEYP